VNGVRAALVFILLICAAPAWAQDAEATAKRLIVASGLAAQLPGLQSQMVAQLAEQRGKLPDALVESLIDAVREAFRPDVMREDVTNVVAKTIALEDMNAALAWLETPVGRRVTRAEEEGSAATDPARLQQFIEREQKAKPSPARAQLLKELFEATYVEETTVRTVEAVALGMALGMDSTQPAEKRLGLARLQAEVKKALPADEVRQKLRETLPLFYAYTYRDVKDADLASYLAFLRSASGKRYQGGVTAAYNEVLIRAAVRLGQLVDQKTTRQPV